MKKITVDSNSGFSLFELVIVVGLLSFYSFFIIYFLINVEVSAFKTYKNYLALRTLKESAEAVLTIKDRGFASLADGEQMVVYSGNQWSLAPYSVEQANGLFIEKITISTPETAVKKISLAIYDKDDRALAKPLQTLNFYLAEYN